MKGQWIKYSALALVVSSALAKDIDITSDAKLQALANEISDSGVLKGYKKITIGGDDVTTLSPLKNLKHVKKGSLFIEDASKLEDLSGLENLAEVDDKFAIDNNKKLTEVNLPSLENVGMSFVVEDNANVKSISLESLSNVGMNFDIDGNDALETLSFDIVRKFALLFLPPSLLLFLQVPHLLTASFLLLLFHPPVFS